MIFEIGDIIIYDNDNDIDIAYILNIEHDLVKVKWSFYNPKICSYSKTHIAKKLEHFEYNPNDISTWTLIKVKNI